MIALSSAQVRRSHWRWLATMLLLAGAGCASVQPPLRDHLASADARLLECAEWFQLLDTAVARSAVSDIGARRVSGFPYLRVDRFLASYKSAAKSDDAVRAAWLDEMRARDAEGRGIEIANLPAAQLEALAGKVRSDVEAHSEACAASLLAADRKDEQALEALYRQAYVADDYSRLKRAIGLYELTRLPFYAGVSGWQQEVEEIFGQFSRNESPPARVTRYLPPREPGYSRREVGEILARARQDPLGVPRLSAAQERRLFATYAPVFDVETAGSFDRIGRLHWSGSATPQVDTSQAVVYHRLGYARAEGRTLLQLIYTAWLPQRPRDGNLDLLGGHLDGIVWRVTLAPDGEPVLFDSIHPCGCYHMFFPTARAQPLPAPEPWTEWAFVPASLPALAETERFVLGLQSATHYLLEITSERFPGDGEGYRLVDYNELRSLPLPGGGRRSVFGPDGLVAGSERGERYLFWPMGIASPGAMRQAGTQATAFVGRRHFDDADLLEKRFRFSFALDE